MADTVRSSAAADEPTTIRYGVLGFACTLSMLTYLDRVIFAVAASAILHSLFGPGASDAALRPAYTAFVFAYAVFEIPSGWLGDVFGPRKTLIGIVLWWSLFTALTGIVGLTIGGVVMGGILVMAAIRFLFGMGEAGAYPNITRALHNWFPLHERGLAQGAVWFSGRLMGGLTPLIWLLLVELLFLKVLALDEEISWRMAFWFFGFIGVLWCIAFAVWFRDRPSQHAGVNRAELELIQFGKANEEVGHAGVPWGALLCDRNLWLLCMMYFCMAYGWYFNITYLPRFLEGQYGVERDSLLGAVYKGGPLIVGALGCLLGGILTDRYVRRTGNLRTGRRLYGVLGQMLCAVCYFLCLFMPSAFWFALAISMAAFWNDVTMGPAWSTCQDIGKKYAAIVAGAMNTIGNLGGAVASEVTGRVLEWSLSSYGAAHGQTAALGMGYQINFIVFGSVYVVAACLWLRIDPTRAVKQE